MHVISWYILHAMGVHCVHFALSSLYQLCECIVCPVSVGKVLLDHNISKPKMLLGWQNVFFSHTRPRQLCWVTRRPDYYNMPKY